MEMKVSELEGAALDWVVAQFDPMCAGLEWQKSDGGSAWVGFGEVDGELTPCAYLSHGTSIRDKMRMMREVVQAYSPSTDWSQGGPLIDKFEVDIQSRAPFLMGKWVEAHSGNGRGAHGSSRLIAACRAIVAAKLGDTISIPSELAGAQS